MPLSDPEIRSAKPTSKPQRLFDGGGLYLEVAPAGGRWWRLKYRYGGKEKRLSLGVYPATGLKAARKKRDDARELLAAGIDPSEQRRSAKLAQADTLEVVAREWIAKRSAKWAPSHCSRILLRLENDVFPWLGTRPVGAISAREILDCLGRIEARGAIETAHRVLGNFGQVMRYAVATGRAERNPAADLRGALPEVNPTHRSAITNPDRIGALLRAIDAYSGMFVTRCALQLAPLLFVRPGELRQAEWVEFNLDQAIWTIPATRMKMRQDHIVPLAPQAVAILRDLQPLTSEGRYVFPGARTSARPMSNNAVNAALRRMGYPRDEMSGHGFRAMARTVLDEVLHVRTDYIEHQLAHAVRDPNGRAYNRTAHLVERRNMMVAWANYLDQLKADEPVAGNVVKITGNHAR